MNISNESIETDHNLYIAQNLLGLLQVVMLFLAFMAYKCCLACSLFINFCNITMENTLDKSKGELLEANWMHVKSEWG